MKKIIALLLALVMVFAMVACGEKPTDANDVNADVNADVNQENEQTPEIPADVKSEGVMTYEQYIAAEMESAVVIEAYVQATQSWYQDAIIVYAQDHDGGYLIYKMACSEADAAKLVPGTKIKVSGFKTQYAGLVELAEGATFEFMEGNYIAEPVDATAWLGTDELIKHQNELVSFKGMTIDSIEYKNGTPGDDIYITASANGQSCNFCVEIYLTGEDTDVYKTVGTLKAGDKVDITGFLYWYEGANPHITSIALAQ